MNVLCWKIKGRLQKVRWFDNFELLKPIGGGDEISDNQRARPPDSIVTTKEGSSQTRTALHSRLHWNSWLPYSTDSYFHPLVFVFVSWVGGGNPPRAVPKSLSLHRGHKMQARPDFFCKLVLCVHRKGETAKKNGKKGLKTHQKQPFLQTDNLILETRSKPEMRSRQR